MDFKIYRGTPAADNLAETAASQLEASMIAQKLSMMEPGTTFIVTAPDGTATSAFLDGDFQF